MFSEYKSNYHDTTLTPSIGGTHILSSGTLTALPNYVCHPRVLEDWYMVFITKGRGILTCSDQVIPLHKGSLFFLFPGVMHAYQTHSHDLLSQQWVAFNGPDVPSMMTSLNITPNNPLIQITTNYDEVARALLIILASINNTNTDNNLYRTGLLYQLLGTVIDITHPSKRPMPSNADLSRAIDKAIALMEAQYRTPLSMATIAQHISLSSSAFYNRFKKEVGITPGNYITSLRLEEARTLIQTTQIPIKDIAERVGYKDPLYFSRIFSEHIGVSPSDYRKKLNTFHPTKGNKGSVNI